MRLVDASEAQDHFARLLDEVAEGQDVTIAKDGVPVARLVPVEGGPRKDISALIDEIKAFRGEHKLGDLTIRELIDEGRRY